MEKLRRFVPRKSGYLIGLAVASLVGGLVSATVMAAIPDASGLIHGCYNTKNGTLKIIDSSSASCTSKETALNWSQGGPGSFLNNLVGANFSNAPLQYRNFAGVDMHNAQFGSAILIGSNFVGANLAGTQFSSTDVTNADFQGANLTGSTIQLTGDANITNFQDVNLSNATLDTVTGDFRGANLHDVSIVGPLGGNFTDDDFRTATITVVNPGFFTGVNFSGANFSGVSFGATGFLSSNLTSTNFTNAKFDGTDFDAGSGEPNTLTGTNFTGAQFLGANLSGDNFSATTLTGATWSNTTCPDGTNSDSNGDTCVGHLVP